MDMTQSEEHGSSNLYDESCNGDDGEMESLNSVANSVVEWLNRQLPDLNVPAESSVEDLRAFLLDGTALCQLLNNLIPGAVEMEGNSEGESIDVERFLSTLDRMGLTKFEVSDLEQGSMANVLKCLQVLKSSYSCNNGVETNHNGERKRWKLQEMEGSKGTDAVQVDIQHSTKLAPDKRRNSWESKFQTVLRSTALSGTLGPDIKISELTKWNSLDKVPTQLLFSMVDRVLDESFDRKSGDVPHRVAGLLKKLIREIERRFSCQAEKIKSQNNLCKVREGKFQSKVKALETLAVELQESEVAVTHLRRIKTEKSRLEEKKKHGEQDVVRLARERDERDSEIRALKQELEIVKLSYEKHVSTLESEAKSTETELLHKINELQCSLEDSRKNEKQLEEISEQEIQKFKGRELRYNCFIDSQFSDIQGLRMTLDSLKIDVLKTRDCYPLEFQHLGAKLKELVDAAENYHVVLGENRKLYNEVQDLKGNIRVYCRIRPFLRGQNEKQTTIEFIGDNGELVVANPLKQGKDTRRLFKFNKIFAPAASQEEVFVDTQPLIRSVLDGYNVCIFAYGQTGSGKTYTMTGPDMTSKKDWGVNYRALHDLFQISQNRRSSILYEVGVQMVEIYNEQVRDLLICDGSQKRLGIWSTTQPNGLAVPDASMHPVKATSDVLELMNIGFMNRAVGATALNERSSRSHSILTVHVRGTDLKSNSALRGCLHLVDLAGSERVDRSEATGDRLKEAQHINKSLSALGDVIFALAQKNSHVPYRNSKLTQVLQSSLGGQAKTLMFVQLNPDAESYSETVSTLKFAERVSGVELGAARTNKEGRDVRELMDQVSSLKDTITKKDEEIERLRLAKATASSEKRGMNSLRIGVSSPRRHSVGPARNTRRSPGQSTRAASDQDYCSEHSDRHSEAGSQQSVEELKNQRDILRHSNLPLSDASQNLNDDIDLLGFGDVDSEERLSDISDSGLSMGTETDGSISSVVEYTLFPEATKPSENTDKSTVPSKLPKPPLRQQTGPSRLSLSKAPSKAVVSSAKKITSTSSSSVKPKIRPPNGSKRWQ
ncbi:kinesin-like protein KIN-14J [Silene latifolia]|uniref:kinesin-like protein KIN-14J n=1 Tax=Silene latifolia TaxID=37657 RepID=UPI003D77E5AC